MPFPDRLPIPDDVLEIAQRLEGAGFETWCVGGAVRDNLLGHENKDFDLATAATPAEVRKLFRRTVPVGLEHGTVAVLDRHGRPHEVTTFRKDVATDGRHAVVAFGVSLDDDLARRDFTVNAIAYHPLRHEWRDPFSGAADLAAGVLRAVGDPALRFREDYLRILRLLRFAARFGFTIDPATWEAARASAGGLRQLSAERVREEWFRGLVTARAPGELFVLWSEVGAVEIWLPELVSGERSAGRAESAAATAASSAHRSPLTGLDRFAQRDAVLMTAYLSADPEATLRRLKCSNAQIERGRRIAEYRERQPDPADEVAVRRWMAAVGPAVDDLVAIHGAAETAEAPGTASLADAVARVRQVGAPLTIGDLAVDGNDLMQAGIPGGPAIGETLRRLLQEVLEDPDLNTKAELVRRAAALQAAAPAHRSPLTPATRRRRKRGKG